MRALCALMFSLPVEAEPLWHNAPLGWGFAALLLVVIVWQSWLLTKKAKPVITTPSLPPSLLYDDITELPNKWLAQHSFNQLMVQGHPQVALLLIKISQFDEVNHQLGYHHANIVLNQIAERLAQFAKTHEHLLPISDHALAHLGGVDFLMLIDSSKRQYQAGFLANQIEQQIAEPLLLRGCAVHYQVRCGISLYPTHGREFNELLSKAHVALQQRNDDSPVYQPQMSEITPEKLAMMAQLQQAIAAQQLQLDVQPQILLSDGQAVAAEVLLRWQHPTQGLLAPKQFIPLAEEMGQMFPLTCWVLEQTIALLAQLEQQGRAIQLAVNISSRDLLEVELAEQISRLLNQYQISGRYLMLELKEDALMIAPTQVLPALRRLAELGITLVLDDFGSGYTSLGMLRELPLKQVKIDAQFIHGMQRSDAQVAITGAIIDLAKNLKLDVVAEGVEEQVTAEKLKRMGCLRAQGFYFSQPFSLHGLADWLRQHQLNNHRPV